MVEVFPSRIRIRRYVAVLLALVLLKIGWTWAMRLDGETLLRGGYRDDLFARRAYLVSRLDQAGAGPDTMPDWIPAQFRGEWALVTYSMSTAAVTNLAFLFPETREEACALLPAWIETVQRPEFRQFDRRRWAGEDALDSLDTGTGHIGYLGHLNFMLAAYHRLCDGGPYTDLFHAVSAALAARVSAQPYLNAETYPGEIYLPDNAVVVSSLALYEQTFPQRATNVAAAWLEEVHQNLRIVPTGLLPFSLSTQGFPLQGPRGSSATWNTFYLFHIDAGFALTHFRSTRESFFDPLWFGLGGMREFPNGVEGYGDIDSGPLVAGFSPAATGFGIAGARVAQDPEVLSGLLLTAEAAGTTWQWNGRRRYLFAPLVGDAILLAMMTATPWSE